MAQSFARIGKRLTIDSDLLAGALLLCGALMAILADNSPLADRYAATFAHHISVGFGGLVLSKSLLLWINEGLMSIFFLLVGIEIKRELLSEGEIQLHAIALPATCAIFGMAVPAGIYCIFNRGNGSALQGWAIPSATDIAFALGALALFAKRLPSGLKTFLTLVAVIDDLGAIVIIAIFYTPQLSLLSLILAALALAGLIALNRLGVARILPYLLVGALLWIFVLKSGVHATLAGVAVGLSIPMGESNKGPSPLDQLEHVLRPWVAFVILPLFAFANSGLSFSNVSVEQVMSPISLGIVAGLALGKPLGIFGGAFAMARLGIGAWPRDANWRMMLGAAMLCGIGFTMSLFIGALAFDASGAEVELRLGVLAGSVLSALAGIAFLAISSRGRHEPKFT